MSLQIAKVYENYYNYIYNYALKLTTNPHDALDITQETFIKAWRKLDTLEEEKALAKWLRTICYHEFLMSIRNHTSLLLLEPDELSMLEQEGNLLTATYPLPQDEVIVAEEIKSLQNGCFLAMVRRLTLNQRIAFSLVDMFGLQIEEVSDLLGLSKGATKGLLYRARMNLDSFFANHCSIIDEKNPCTCHAWIDFSESREEMQAKARQLVNHLDYKESDYVYQEEIRAKLFSLYSQMPEQKPSKEWYESVLKIFAEK